MAANDDAAIFSSFFWEGGEQGGELGGDAVVAEIADTSRMGVVYFAGWAISAVLHLQPHLPVGFAERSACENATVDFLDSEKIVVARILDDILTDINVLKHEIGHIEAGNHFSSSREYNVLQQLEIAVIS